MARVKRPLDKSPVETNQPCAQQEEVPTSMASLRSHSAFSIKAMLCCTSAMIKLTMRMRNWFVLVFSVPLMNRYANRNSSVDDRKKDKNPNAETAARPRVRTSGSGVNVSEEAVGILAVRVCVLLKQNEEAGIRKM